METEDFSFPRISDTYPYTIDSPPLWNLSPATSPNPYQVFRDGKGYENGRFEAKVINQGQRKRVIYEGEEEKMDLLWEDFNEELSSANGSAPTSSKEIGQLRCASALTIAKNNGALGPTRNKPRMVVLVKVLKKLFSLSNSHGKGKPRRKVC